MGLFQRACETYEFHENLAGVIQDGKIPLAPCSHSLATAALEVTIDQDGDFIRAAAVDKNESKIIIPVTEGSANRTGNSIIPHPLCEQLRYLLPDNPEHYSAYLKQLERWADSPFTHPKLRPILRYVQGGSILSDLLKSGVIRLKEGKPENEKLIVRWNVNGLGLEDSGPCWTDQALFRAFDGWYQEQKKSEEPVFCMLTGQWTAPANYHMKGVVPLHGNAKLISSNDSSNFTYRGRFLEPEQGETVGYDASQKAHNALRWLISNQAESFGSRFFVCWEPQQITLPPPSMPYLPAGMELPPIIHPSEYQKQLRDTLNGWKSTLPSDSATAVIVSFDAASKGRLAITYYNELKASDFLDRLGDWDEHCCWPNGKFGIQAPSVWQIVRCAFGTQREEKGRTILAVDDKLLSQQMQRLTICRINGAKMPADLVHYLVRRASHPLSYDRNVWLGILFNACAVLRKYRYDFYKEEWNMALEPDKKDRSYQFGRMLAVLDKLEADTYPKGEERTTNAIKAISVFTQRPLSATETVWKKLQEAYAPRLNPESRTYYEKLFQEILANISECSSSELNQPLEPTYLMGYYLQRQELYTSHKDKNTQNENGGNEE